jgi:hypothetical protein
MDNNFKLCVFSILAVIFILGILFKVILPSYNDDTTVIQGIIVENEHFPEPVVDKRHLAPPIQVNPNINFNDSWNYPQALYDAQGDSYY